MVHIYNIYAPLHEEPPGCDAFPVDCILYLMCLLIAYPAGCILYPGLMNGASWVFDTGPGDQGLATI